MPANALIQLRQHQQDYVNKGASFVLLVIALSSPLLGCEQRVKNREHASRGSGGVVEGTPVSSPQPMGNPTASPALAPVHKTEPLVGVSEANPLCGLSAGNTGVDPSPQRAARFMTQNVYGAFSSSLDSLAARINMLAGVFHKAEADVIGLQEIEDMRPSGLTVEPLAKRLTELTGHTWYWCFFRSNPHAAWESDPNRGGGGPLSAGLALIESNARKLNQLSWYMGDAILSRYPFGSAGARRISPRAVTESALCQTDQCRQWATGESRVVIRAEILLQGRSVHFFNSHFYTDITPDSSKSQKQQAKEIAAYMAEVGAVENAPAALTCDCNSPEEGVVRAEFLASSLKDAWNAAMPSHLGYTGGQNISSETNTAQKRIDYIFLKGIAPSNTQTLPEAPAVALPGTSIFWPSDHLGVITEISNTAP